MRSAERRKVNVLEMKCLRSLVGVSRMDRVRNEEVRRRAGIEREITSRADQRVLRWFGHVERMDEYHMERRFCACRIRCKVHWRVGRRLGSFRLISVQPLIGSTIREFCISAALWVLGVLCCLY